MNATRYWKGREDVCAVATSSNTKHFSLPYSAVNLLVPLAITVGRFPIANNCTRWCYIILKVSHRTGDGQIFLKGSMHASPYRLRPLLARSTSLNSTFNRWLPFMSTLHWTVVCSAQSKLIFKTHLQYTVTPQRPIHSPCFHQLKHKKARY
jgi:hypothetical protein